ncbi:TPA: hypothetical protein DD425_02275 [Candidatus Saccharibacteria bacterium]|nr:hypothetical protein [Candidatus Saccharibacteria bacterium]
MNGVTFFLVLLLGGLVVFQVLLALGAPFGKAAWGGQHTSVLPRKLRVASAISVVLLLCIISVVLSFTGIVTLYPNAVALGILWVSAVYFGVGVVMNAISRSRIERVWSPYSAVICILMISLIL